MRAALCNDQIQRRAGISSDILPNAPCMIWPMQFLAETGGLGKREAARTAKLRVVSRRYGMQGCGCIQKGPSMNEPLQVILAKTTLAELYVHIGRAGLSMGDPAELAMMENGRIGVYALMRRRWLGLWPHQVQGLVGLLDARDSAVLAPFLRKETALRVRIVALTPEHLAGNAMSGARGTEISLSVWGAIPVVPRPPEPALMVRPAQPLVQP